MVRVPPGVFTMGEDRPQEYKTLYRAGPPHDVELTQGFFMGKCEVTLRQYLAVGLDAPARRRREATLECPITDVSWRDATAFCRKLSELMGRHFRLPTEAEWEYACRAGTRWRFSCGDNLDALERHAWLATNSGKELHPVGEKLPNLWGIHDMHGNAAEWCLDWFDERYYRQSPRICPTGPYHGQRNVVRGGSCADDASRLGSATRNCWPPAKSSPLVGFRVVMDETPTEPLPSATLKPQVLLKVTGAFVEAETASNAARLGGPIAFDGASGGKVLRGFARAGEPPAFRLALEKEMYDVCVALRVVASREQTDNLGKTLAADLMQIVEGQARPVASVVGFRSFVQGQDSGDGPKWLRSEEAFPELSSGKYMLRLICKTPAPECLLDLAGLATVRGNSLPNVLVDGVLKEGGYYIDTGRGAKAEP